MRAPAKVRMPPHRCVEWLEDATSRRELVARHFLVDSMNKSDSETTQRRLHTATVDMVVIGIPHFPLFAASMPFFGWLKRFQHLAV